MLSRGESRRKGAPSVVVFFHKLGNKMGSARGVAFSASPKRQTHTRGGGAVAPVPAVEEEGRRGPLTERRASLLGNRRPICKPATRLRRLALGLSQSHSSHCSCPREGGREIPHRQSPGPFGFLLPEGGHSGGETQLTTCVRRKADLL